MSLYLNTEGNSQIAVAICDRCKFKKPITSLVADPNYPGLRVCEGVDNGCMDLFDPYRLPARQTENISLRYPRPDLPLTNVLAYLQAENGSYILTEEGDELEVEY